jgi:hypothetical protein
MSRLPSASVASKRTGSMRWQLWVLGTGIGCARAPCPPLLLSCHHEARDLCSPCRMAGQRVIATAWDPPGITRQ